ncbi:dienelactone hydrolase family protein [Streptomyces sp. NPDC046261]|uniref:dienelactone hydrolase family protein n=1 Tax=Streptomyces sp. NPDC046261 TaxID=3157200 RepID=UPI00340ABD19
MPSRMLDIPTPDGTADAFLALPDGGGTHPGVLLYMDAIGLRPVLREMAEQLSAHGYCVLVPNVFHRTGRAPVVEIPDLKKAENREVFFSRVLPLLAEHTPQRALSDAQVYLDFLTARPEVRPGPVGVVGYCMGAALALRTAAAHPGQVAAVAGFHPGSLATDSPDSPHLLAPKLTAEIHLGIAEHDDAMPPEAITRLSTALDEAGVRHTCEVYPGTLHGFTMADTAVFDQAGLDRHWDRLLNLFARTLTAG